MNIFPRRILFFFLAFQVVCGIARAQDFRVETDLFVEKAKQPTSENLTLFSGDLVYDFLLNAPEETTIFDLGRKRFILLDHSRRVRTTITTEQLLEFTSTLKAEAQEKKGVFHFAAYPDFKRSGNSQEEGVKLSSKPMTYLVKGAPPKFPQAVGRYQQFADWYARLNSMRPSNMPPFARMELNRVLAEEGVIPQEVELTLVFSSYKPFFSKKYKMRTKHLSNWLLSNTDRKRIEEAGDQMSQYTSISPKQYLTPAEK